MPKIKNKKENKKEEDENLILEENLPEISLEKKKIVVDSNSSYLQYLLLIELKKIANRLELLEKIIEKIK